MILAGDIGGTNSRLALFEVKGPRFVMHERGQYANEGRKSLIEIVREFLDPLQHRPRIACFGVAGPVRDGKVTLTNLHWKLEEKRLQEQLRVRRMALINDLVAHAEGTNILSSDGALVLQKGKAHRRGNRAILAPGTGLGEAGMVFDSDTNDYRAIASEGGHCDFAPRSQRDIALMKFVRNQQSRGCSWEDLLSGEGLVMIWRFLISRGEFHIKPGIRPRKLKPADITAGAMSGKCKACIAAVEIFAELCGAEAGNLALKFLATGGVFIGGGIPPKILKYLTKPALRRAFCSKGPSNVRQLLRAMPIKVITSNDNALYGAAHYANKL